MSQSDKAAKARQAAEAQAAMRAAGAAQQPQSESLTASGAVARRVVHHPWDHANPKYKPHVQLRTPEPLKMKLDFLAERHARGHKSMQDILIHAVERYVDELLAEELAKETP